MSPSEHDLRASLQHGEGDPVNVDRIVAAGATARSQRRNRLAGVAAAVVLVTAGASVTGVVLARDDGVSDSGASSYDARADAAGTAAGGAEQSRRSAQQVPAPDPAPSSAGSAHSGIALPAPAACPATFPQRMMPGGGSPGQFGADTPLFASEPVSITACRYAATGAVSGSAVLTGRDATALRVSLEQGARTAPSCPIARPAVPVRRLAFLGIDGSGKPLRVVTTTTSTSYCDARTTNGTAVRFTWAPPASLVRRLGLSGVTVSPSPTGRVIGSPVR